MDFYYLILKVNNFDQKSQRQKNIIKFPKDQEIKMINPLFLPQHYKRRKKTTIEEVSQINTVRRQFKLIHQLDCIYQGQINESYQKQGFGIQQTNDFFTYIGYWKSGKTNGIGMVLFPEGGLIYGNFKQNDLYGIGLIDNKNKLRIGQFENYQIVGIGFEYVYSETKWKLCRFHKGIAIETISSTVQPIENGIPLMMNLHEDMYVLLSRYISQQYFDVSNKSFIDNPYRSYTEMNVHKISKNFIYFGQMVQGKYWGLGLIFDKKTSSPLEIGYYQMGELNGYAIKIDKDKNKIQIGLYKMGKKEGFFYEKIHNLQIIVQYVKNYVKGQSSEMNRQKLKNLQKIFNYQKNDFYSEKNKINFQRYKDLLNYDQKQLLKLNQTLRHNILGNKSKPKHDKAQKIHSDKKGVKYMAPQTNVHKSTVQIMRQKLSDIDNIIKRSKAMMKQENKKKQSKKQLQKNKNHIQVDDDQQKKEEIIEDESIEEQYQPIDKNLQMASQNRANKKRHYTPLQLRDKSPRKRIQSPQKIVFNNTTGQKRVTIDLDQNQVIKPFQLFTDKSPKTQRKERSVSQRKKRRIFE